MKRIVLILAMLTASSALALGQAPSAALRAGDLQVGATYSFVKPDYSPQNGLGFGIYSDFDFTQHFGVSVAFHDISISQHSPASETTYEIGGRYRRQYGIFKPYVKAMVGRGEFHFADNFHSNPVTEGFNNPQSGQTSGYNLFAVAGGVDFPVSPRFNVRVEGEYQHWSAGYNLQNALTPILFSGGIAYHFNAGWPR